MTTSLDRLLEMMAQLRDAQKGCGWSRLQDFDSITRYTLEEAYELIAAIDAKDWNHVKEEMGDMLFQLIFYAQMAQEKNLFNFDDVILSLQDKLKRRVPHVFSDTPSDTDAAQAEQNWNDVKAQEKMNASTITGAKRDFGDKTSPALIRAYEVTKQAEDDKLTWRNATDIHRAIHDEALEVAAAETPEHIAEEIGDLLWSVVGLARHHRVNPERALQKSTNKFIRRWEKMTELAAANEQKLSELDPAVLDDYWMLAKAKED